MTDWYCYCGGPLLRVYPLLGDAGMMYWTCADCGMPSCIPLIIDVAEDEPTTCPECGIDDEYYSLHNMGCPSGFPTREE